MSSVVLCSRCGGTIGAAIAGKKACGCSRTGSAVATATLEPPAKMKHCATCGKDVTNEKRMKDSVTGKYWCYECGIKQPGAKTQAALCPLCKQAMSIHSMYRHNDQYICQTCHDAKTTGKGKVGKGGEGGGKTVLLLALAVLAVIAVSAYLNGWLPI